MLQSNLRYIGLRGDPNPLLGRVLREGEVGRALKEVKGERGTSNRDRR